MSSASMWPAWLPRKVFRLVVVEYVADEIHHWPIVYGRSVEALQHWFLYICWLRIQSGEALLRDNFEKNIEEIDTVKLCCFDNVRAEPRGTMTERQTSIVCMGH